MNYYSSKPSIILSQLVKQYWAIEDSYTTGSNENILRIIPNGLMGLTFYLGEKPKAINNDNKDIHSNVIISGQQQGFYDIILPERLSIFSVLLQPYGAKMLFNIPSNEFFDKNISLRSIIKEEVNELEDKLYFAESFQARVSIIENFLIKQLIKNYNENGLNRIMHSIGLITNSKGQISIDTLSSSSCLSRKQYERIFLDSIGISPKQFLRIVRFQNSLSEKQNNKNISFTELAYSCGYADQSHMINNYKLLSGLTPSQYFAECEPVSDFFL